MINEKKLWISIILGIVLVILISGYVYFSRSNLYQTEGEATLEGLTAAASVIRDEKGMPYIYASNLSDLIKVQGYVTAQDRLFQMHLTRLFAEGRLTELAGGIAKELDVRMRTIGLYRNAVKHAKILDREKREMLQAFADGVNQFIESNKDELQLEFKLAGVQPEPWKIEDSLAIIYYMGWGSAANMQTEMVSQMLLEKIGLERYLENGKSIPFHVISETLKIKDKSIDSGFREEVVKVRLSRRGPVISGVLKPLETQKVVTMRWAPFETMQPSLGIDFLLKAKSTDDFHDSLRSTTAAHFNIIFADIKGNLGWRATGRLPIRNYGNGTIPVDANRHPNTWAGWISYDDMPHQNNSDRDWIGNANHNTVKKSYPYKKETLTDLIQLAALKAKDELSEKHGKDIDSWKWGKVHQIVNTNPIRRKGFGKDWLGGGSHPMGGYGETLYRALYDFNNSDEIKYSAVLRMVADLADGEKVVAVMHGGVTGRTFHPNFTDQIDAYHDGSKLYWWFSDKKIQEHKKSELTLIPPEIHITSVKPTSSGRPVVPVVPLVPWMRMMSLMGAH